MIDHAATRQDLTRQVAAFIADPTGWPAAMAARALRLRAGHRPYSPSNHALIVGQLFQQFAATGLAGMAAYQAAIAAATDEIAPRSVWARRGYTPAGTALAVWSRPIPIYIDPATGDKVTKTTAGAVERRLFRIELTYRATEVTNDQGETGAAAFTAPELPAGEARDVFERLTAWITGQGWTVERTGRNIREGGYTAHAARRIVVNGALAGWAAVETLAHEIAHALLHGADDDRPYAGEHRGDMEAEAGAVAYGLLVAFGQGELARGAARYAAEWTRNPERVAVAYDRSCRVLDAVAGAAFGATDAVVTHSAKAERAQTKADNKALAAALREAGLEPKGEAWRRAKAGEPIETIAAALATAA